MNKFELNSRLIKITRANVKVEKIERELEELINLCTLIHNWSAVFDQFLTKYDHGSNQEQVYIFYIDEFGVNAELEKYFDNQKKTFVKYKITFKGNDNYELLNI